jgi:hypothetical protein
VPWKRMLHFFRNIRTKKYAVSSCVSDSQVLCYAVSDQPISKVIAKACDENDCIGLIS